MIKNKFSDYKIRIYIKTTATVIKNKLKYSKLKNKLKNKAKPRGIM